MKLDYPGREFIKQFEGLRLEPYQDDAGVWTIGWGHTGGVSEWAPEITREQAEVLLIQDLEPFEKTVTLDVSVPISQNQFTSLVSFAFNEGAHAFHTSTLLEKLNNGDIQGAGKEFMRWVYVEDPKGEMKIEKGLVVRRNQEMLLFLKDFYAIREAAGVKQLL